MLFIVLQPNYNRTSEIQTSDNRTAKGHWDGYEVINAFFVVVFVCLFCFGGIAAKVAIRRRRMFGRIID